MITTYMPSMYWAGPRCFSSSLRWYDLRVIRHLEKMGWKVYYPLLLVKEEIDKNPGAKLLGRYGLIRTTCLGYIEKADIIVAYVGLFWDTGTAHELEYAVQLGKPILMWSDSSVYMVETLGRNLETSNPNEMFCKALPLNAMSVVCDRFVEVSELYNEGISPEELAKLIDRNAREILKNKK